jgi:hypothetical protein
MHAVSKFAVEGWPQFEMDLAPFNTKTTLVNPEFIRTRGMDGT